MVWEEQRASSGSPLAEIPARGLSPGWRDGALTLLAVLACLLVLCGVVSE